MSNASIENIRNCQRCNLCKNQKPLLDNKETCQVMWIGLSAKQVKNNNEIPLAPRTNSGNVIKKIETSLKNVSFYKTNIVKCPPLDNRRELRYPDNAEIDSCFDILLLEINALSPKIVFLLGEKVSAAVSKRLGIKFLPKSDEFSYVYQQYQDIFFVPIQHPSYIYTYRKRDMNEYINAVRDIILKLL